MALEKMKQRDFGFPFLMWICLLNWWSNPKNISDQEKKKEPFQVIDNSFLACLPHMGVHDVVLILMRMKILINDRAIRHETVHYVIVTLTRLVSYASSLCTLYKASGKGGSQVWTCFCCCYGKSFFFFPEGSHFSLFCWNHYTQQMWSIHW